MRNSIARSTATFAKKAPPWLDFRSNFNDRPPTVMAMPRMSLHSMLGWMTTQQTILEQRFIANEERVAANTHKATGHGKQSLAARQVLPAPPLLRRAPGETGLPVLYSRPLYAASAEAAGARNSVRGTPVAVGN